MCSNHNRRTTTSFFYTIQIGSYITSANPFINHIHLHLHFHPRRRLISSYVCSELDMANVNYFQLVGGTGDVYVTSTYRLMLDRIPDASATSNSDIIIKPVQRRVRTRQTLLKF